MTKYFISADCNSNFFVVPEDRRKEWEAWVDQMKPSINAPDWVHHIDRGLDRITFEFPLMDGEPIFKKELPSYFISHDTANDSTAEIRYHRGEDLIEVLTPRDSHDKSMDIYINFFRDGHLGYKHPFVPDPVKDELSNAPKMIKLSEQKPTMGIPCQIISGDIKGVFFIHDLIPTFEGYRIIGSSEIRFPLDSPDIIGWVPVK